MSYIEPDEETSRKRLSKANLLGEYLNLYPSITPAVKRKFEDDETFTLERLKDIIESQGVCVELIYQLRLYHTFFTII